MLVEVERSGLVESVHRVSVAVVDLAGRLLADAGDPRRPFYLRSAAKPFQAAVSQRLGADLAPEHLAVACASHDGQPVHLAQVEAILAAAGLTEHDLACPPAWPIDAGAGRRLAAAGFRAPRSLWHNCSGKHAAMLAACVARGWETTGYWAPDHPLQREMAAELGAVGGAATASTGVDGCGVPTFPGDVTRLARAFVALVTESRFAEVVTAMHRYPALVSGTGNPDAVAATWLQAVAKRGAEGCLGIALPHHGAVGIKIWDGASRATGPVALRVLDEMGWIPHGAREEMGRALELPVSGGGRTVGSVRVTGELRWR